MFDDGLATRSGFRGCWGCVQLTLHLLASGFSGGREVKMAISKTKSITAFFEPSKRLQMDAEGQAAVVSHFKQGSKAANELTKVTNVIDNLRAVSTTAKGSDMRDLHPLLGFKPPLSEVLISTMHSMILAKH